MDQVAIIIVNWNTGSLLAQCIGSLQRVADINRIAKVIVIDNASRDDSIGQAQAARDGTLRVEFISLKVNEGFAVANNIGIAKIISDGFIKEHFLLLNPDTEVISGAVTSLLDALGRYRNVGIVGPKLLHANGFRQDSVRRFPKLLTLVWILLKLHRILPRAQVWQSYIASDFDYNKESIVEQVMGAAFLIRRSVWENVGSLDERFFVWFEEVDYCLRARGEGWLTLYTPRANVLHYGGASFNQLVGLRRSLPWISSLIVYAHKHLSKPAVALLCLCIPLAVLLIIPAALVHESVRTKNKDIL